MHVSEICYIADADAVAIRATPKGYSVEDATLSSFYFVACTLACVG